MYQSSQELKHLRFHDYAFSSCFAISTPSQLLFVCVWIYMCIWWLSYVLPRSAHNCVHVFGQAARVHRVIARSGLWSVRCKTLLDFFGGLGERRAGGRLVIKKDGIKKDRRWKAQKLLCNEPHLFPSLEPSLKSANTDSFLLQCHNNNNHYSRLNI